jgi:RNA polymerase sigma-70 factor, ECF subfamily
MTATMTTPLAARSTGSQGSPVRPMATDPDSLGWLRDLAPESPAREAAAAKLHALLLRITRGEFARRAAHVPPRGRDGLDDLCVQAASDALLAVLGKLRQYRGQSRFTTWAAKFAIYEISVRLRRHAWRERRIATDGAVLDRLVDPAPEPVARLLEQEAVEQLNRAMQQQLTDRQRMIFRAAVLEDVPIDVLAERLESSRGAIYKTVHDARRKLRRAIDEMEES